MCVALDIRDENFDLNDVKNSDQIEADRNQLCTELCRAINNQQTLKIISFSWSNISHFPLIYLLIESSIILLL